MFEGGSIRCPAQVLKPSSGGESVWEGVGEVPRLWVRLPNWLGDLVMLIPLLRLIRRSKQRAVFVFVGKAGFEPVLRRFGFEGQFMGLPERSWRYFFHFVLPRGRRPDACLIFTNSLRGDLEACVSGGRLRLGQVRRGRRRPLLTHGTFLPTDLESRKVHQVRGWEHLVRSWGVEGEVDWTPLSRDADGVGADAPVGLIAGSENFPAKRWPVDRWRELIRANSDRRFVLFGTSTDRAISERIAEGFDAERVVNLAGRTGMVDYMTELARCARVVSNDTGGMHLANALGVPVVALFGPTNPLKTGPVFSGPVKIVQPEGCPSEGGGDLGEVRLSCVSKAAQGCDFVSC